MATKNELNVQFKLDTTDLKRGSKEAEDEVKKTASKMESDVKQSSDSMESHLDKVADSAKNIGDAAKDAGSSVKDLEHQVSQSSDKMAADLGKVSENVRKISGRQAGMLTARGLGLAANMVSWAGENFTEEGSEGRLYADVGSSALSGAASGAALGTMIAPGVGTAIGAAAGALTGAASSLFEASKKLEEAAEAQRANSENALQSAGRDLHTRNRIAGYERENRKFLSDLSTPASGAFQYSAIDRVYDEQKKRQDWLRQKERERDEFISQHQYDTGDKAVESATQLEMLNHAVQVAQERLGAFAPVLQEATRLEAEYTRAEEERIREEERAAAQAEENSMRIAAATQKEEEARARAAEREEAAAQKEEEKSLRGQQRAAEKTLSETQRQLQGVISNPFLGAKPSDALTRMGGGGGYAAFNNSTAKVQIAIENHLKKLVSNQQTQLQQIIDKLQNLNIEGTWGE